MHLLRRRLLSEDPRRNPVRRQQRAAVDPSVSSVPPCRTNFASSCNPSGPMPPRMSSLESRLLKFGVCAVRLYGSGALPLTARPLTWLEVVPPTLGNTITSYFVRRSPSCNF